MRIFWSNKNANKIKKSFLNYFVIFYTFDSERLNNFEEFHIELENNDNLEEDWWTDLDAGTLFPNTNYWIRIDAQNTNKKGVKGSYFQCYVPKGYILKK